MQDAIKGPLEAIWLVPHNPFGLGDLVLLGSKIAVAQILRNFYVLFFLYSALSFRFKRVVVLIVIDS